MHCDSPLEWSGCPHAGEHLTVVVSACPFRPYLMWTCCIEELKLSSHHYSFELSGCPFAFVHLVALK